MSKLLLIHNSDTLFDTLKPPDNKRPNFYWYTDRFCSNLGTSKYMYIFVIDPVKDNVELRSRSSTQDFDGLHKDFLHYRDYCEGKYPDLKYAESGIAMSFSKLTPTITLMARSYGSGKDDWLQTEFEIIKSHKPFNKRVISLFEASYQELYAGKPLKFTDIPELVELLPGMDYVLPFMEIQPDENGIYGTDSWLPMSTHQKGTWL